MKIQDWLNEFNKSNYIMDEMRTYILSRIFGMGIGIILKKSIWMTKKNNDATDVDIWFTYLGLGSFLPLTPLEPEEEKKLMHLMSTKQDMCTRRWSQVSLIISMKSFHETLHYEMYQKL